MCIRDSWTAILPFHAVVFPEMAANILAEARRRHDGGERPRTRGLLRPLVDRLPLRRNPLDRRARGAGGAQSRD